MLNIEITASSINVVQVSGSSKIQVKRAFSVPTPPRSVKNGQLKDINAISEALRSLLLFHNIRQAPATFILNSMTLKTKEIVAPKIGRPQLLQILEKEFAEIAGGEEHFYDYFIWAVQGKQLYCTALACPQSLLVSYFELARACDLKVKRVDLHTNAMHKLWESQNKLLKRSLPKNLNKKADSTESSTGILPEQPINQKLQLWAGVYYDEIKILTNSLDGNFFSKTIMLSSFDGISAEADTKDSNEDKKLFARYADEIQKFVSFQQSVHRTQGIEEVLLYGDYHHLTSICGPLEQLLHIPVRAISPGRGVRGLKADEYPKYCCAAAAGLRR